MTGKRGWLRWVGLVLVAFVLLVAFALARVLVQRAEHRRLREAEVGRAPVAAPKRFEKAVTRPVVAADATACVHGQVLDHGAPVADMQVSIPDDVLSVSGACACAGCRCAEGLELLVAQPRAGLLAPVKSTTSRADGTFSLCGLEAKTFRLVWGEHEDGRLALMKEAPEVRPGSWVPLEVVNLVPTPGLVRAQERGLEGARILAWLRPGFTVREVTSDAAGRFSLPLLPGGAVLFLVVAPGRRPVMLERVPEAGTLVVLDLDEPYELTVRALHRGEGVAGAEVTVGKEPPRTTDEQGLVLVKDLPTRERLRVTARKGELIGTAAVWTLPGASQRLELSLSAGVRVRGAIVDEKGGPRIGRVRGLGAAALETDARGRFESEPLEASRDVYPEAVVEGCDADRSTALQPGMGDHLLLKVRCEATVEGIVLDADGAPIANAVVTLQAPKHTEAVGTDAAGRFTLHQPAGSYRLKVTHERYRSAEQPLTAPAKDVTVVLDAGGSISGRVVDGQGRPVAGAEVVGVPAMLEDLLKELEGGSSKTTTDAQGQFLVPGLLAGRWVLAVTGNSLPTTPSDVVVLQPGQHRQGLVIIVEAKVDLSGVVLDERKQPVPGARVRWDPVDEEAAMSALLLDAVQGRMDDALRFMPSPAFSDADGRFELKGLPVSELKLDVSAAGFRDAELEATRGSRVQVTLQRVGGRVKGRVLDEGGRPMPRFEVNGTDFASGDGRFEVMAWSRDDDVRVRATGYATTTKPVTMDAPEKDVGDITLTKGKSVRVTAVTADRKPLEGVRISGTQPSLGGDSCSTHSDGVCTLTSLVDEELTVAARKAGFESPEVKLEKGRLPETLEVTMKAAGGRLEGLVFGSPGRPAAARSVQLSGTRFTEFTLTNERGRFDATGLPEGDLCASVELSGLMGIEWAAPVKVTSSPVSVELGPTAQGGALEVGAKLPGRVVALQGEHPPLRTVDVAGDSAHLLCGQKRVMVVAMIVTGAARLEGLPPGRWSVYVVAISDSENEAPIAPKVIDLLSGETKKVP
ncbi:MAG: carboxypeptidase regulatory-like domain-containing protein [Myxococcaceae bacterium]|nr:carboxypeptidase regulatory-like domain-containing protein [Myxococcaceae bacterium]